MSKRSKTVDQWTCVIAALALGCVMVIEGWLVLGTTTIISTVWYVAWNA